MGQSWSERVDYALKLATASDRTSVTMLVDLLFENPIPMNPILLDDQEVGKLLKYRGTSPRREIEEVKVAVAYQKWIRKCMQFINEIRNTLQSFPNSALKDEVLDLAIMAAGFKLVIELDHSSHSHADGSVKHINIQTSETVGASALDQLCKIRNPVTDNILHKITTKKDVIVREGTCTSFRESTVSFSSERQKAENELANRGNPIFDPKHYFVA